MGRLEEGRSCRAEGSRQCMGRAVWKREAARNGASNTLGTMLRSSPRCGARAAPRRPPARNPVATSRKRPPARFLLRLEQTMRKTSGTYADGAPGGRASTWPGSNMHGAGQIRVPSCMFAMPAAWRRPMKDSVAQRLPTSCRNPRLAHDPGSRQLSALCLYKLPASPRRMRPWRGGAPPFRWSDSTPPMFSFVTRAPPGPRMHACTLSKVYTTGAKNSTWSKTRRDWPPAPKETKDPNSSDALD